jgi:hypothetical protein
MVPFIFLFACSTVLNKYPYREWLKIGTWRTPYGGDGYAKVGIGSMWGPARLAGFRVEFSEFCAILMNVSLSLLVSLVYLNLGRIRLLQHLSTKKLLP